MKKGKIRHRYYPHHYRGRSGNYASKKTRKPVNRKVIAGIILLTLTILAFVGVHPLVTYKDYTLAKLNGFRMIFYQTPEETQASYERDIASAFDMMNEARAKEGANPFTEEPMLDELAMKECLHMKEVHRMTHPHTWEWDDFIRSQEGKNDYNYPQTGSCAYLGGSPEGAVEAWIKSKMGHREIMLAPQFKRAGLAFVVANRFWGDGYACLIVSE